MKSKTIKAVLRKKIDEWLATVWDDDTRQLLANNVIVTGGAIASMLLKEKVNDYDVYFRTRDAAVAAARLYVPEGGQAKVEVQEDRVRIVTPSGHRGTTITSQAAIDETYENEEEAAQAVEDTAYKPLFISTNAITLSGKIQLVLRFFGEPDAIHENYDFVHCTNYWTAWNDELVLRQPALEALLSRELRYVGSKYPLASIIRLRKFIKRNWTINAGQILKMVMQLNELDLTDPKVLEDQLTGVDMAYFADIISKCNDRDPTKVNTAYLVEIIDRMF
jgi:hypothetical protein